MSDKKTTAFIDFLLTQNVLKFGEFTLNSGRVSPYFFNLGEVSGGAAFATLGEAYADALEGSGLEFDVLFGPAYKGIPIAVATAVALARRGVDVGVAYNRKEAKDHGEGGRLVGAPVEGRVLLIDDVLTSGKAIRDAASLIADTQADIVGCVIAMDRQEITTASAVSGDTAVQALARDLNAPVTSIANLGDLIQYLDQSDDPASTSTLAGMRDYQAQYCQVTTV